MESSQGGWEMGGVQFVPQFGGPGYPKTCRSPGREHSVVLKDSQLQYKLHRDNICEHMPAHPCLTLLPPYSRQKSKEKQVLMKTKHELQRFSSNQLWPNTPNPEVRFSQRVWGITVCTSRCEESEPPSAPFTLKDFIVPGQSTHLDTKDTLDHLLRAAEGV